MLTEKQIEMKVNEWTVLFYFYCILKAMQLIKHINWNNQNYYLELDKLLLSQ